MIHYYLRIYNVLLCIGWCIYLFYATMHGFTLNRFSLTVLNICQTAALLEIVHATLKWTSSPVSTTTLQVFSRVFVLYWINVVPAQNQLEVLHISGITIISLAWSITEIVRYSHYFFSLSGRSLSVLNYLRYTLFIFLYPLGITGEAMIMISALTINEWEINLSTIIIIIVLISYIPFFPKLYGYMWRQRRKKLTR